MSAEVFFDSNVLLYVVSRDKRKADRAEALLTGGGTVSVQVLNECAIRPVDLETHERGLDLHERYRYSIYDSMLLASALAAGCTTMLSEDMQHEQRIGDLVIRNPFR